MFEIHDRVLVPRPGRKITLQEAEVTEVSNTGNYLTVKFGDNRRYSKITIHADDVVKVAV